MRGPLVLIEPYAHHTGGHHHRTLVALAQARPGSLVIALRGIAPETAASLRQAGARTATTTAGLAATALSVASAAAARLSAAGQRVFASRRWPRRVRRIPHQASLVARCLAEAAALRTARRTHHAADAVVIMTASEALHGAAALLGGQPHLRFVHGMDTTEDAVVRLLGHLARTGEPAVVALSPTAAVQTRCSAAFPRLACAVRPFAVDDGARLTSAERRNGRTSFGIAAEEPAACLVGGWWPHKDIATVDAALALLTEPLHLIVAGSPHDAPRLDRWHALPAVRLHTVPGPVSEADLRLIYGCADAALVLRHPGTGTESGLVVDAVRLGVALIVSDHDPDLTAHLRAQPWARITTAGDSSELAEALGDLGRRPRAEPGADAARRLGIPTAPEQADFLARTFACLPQWSR